MFDEQIKNYFTFSKKEKQGISILIILIIFVIMVLIYLDFSSSSKYEFFSNINEKEIVELNKLFLSSDTIKEKDPELFFFDPNTASNNEFTRLGLNEPVIRIIEKYRENGGKFYKKEDFKKIYRLQHADYLRLFPYIKIKGKSIKKEEQKQEQDDDVPIETKLNTKSTRIRIDVNRACSNDLMKIKGIGPVFSERIIKYRNLLGGFTHLDQLKEVYGLKDIDLKLVENYLFVDSANVNKINLNKISKYELKNHPYISSYQAEAIIEYRSYKGEIATLKEIIDNKLLPIDVYNKVQKYFTVE